MKTIKLIIKGVLLYVTFLLSFFFLAGVDSIYDNEYFIQFIIVIIALCYICYRTISKEELKILTMDKLLNK